MTEGSSRAYSIAPLNHPILRRVLVIVATPDLPQGGSGSQKPPKRRPWRGTPLDVQRRRISDEEADVRGEARRVRAPTGRGRHELHPGRARGVSKRTGKAWRNGRTRATGRNEETPGGLVSFHHGQAQDPPSALPEPGGAHPDRGPSASGRFDPRHRPPAGPRPRHGRSAARSSATGIPSPAVTSLTAPSRRPPDRLKRPKPRKAAEGTRLWDEIAAGLRRHWSPEQIANRLSWTSRIMGICTRASRRSTRPSTCRRGANSSRS